MKSIFKNKALENIKVAELAYEHGCFDASTNRAYYAAFDAAIYAIYSIGIEPKIDHSTIHSIFADNFFNRRKILSVKFKRYLGDLRDKRNIADYKSGVSKKVAKHQLEYAKELVFIIFEVIK